ncbi:MAG: DNA polymerase III subunit delta [Actinobacteria bacterium]|nr:DNA polymerase III subunit delta [Actinomycetota bacterium]
MDKGKALLIYGDQALLVEEELKKVLARIGKEVDPEFNLDFFRAGEDRLEEALRAAETLPFASGWRYVVVKEAQRLTPAEIKSLVRYLEDPPESATLILVGVGLKDGSSLVKEVGKRGRVRKASLSRREIPLWIKGRFEERGLRVNGRALSYLLESLGEDLMAIEAAVEKISLFHEGRGMVELDEVVSLVSPSAERTVYELVDRVAVGDADQALKILRRLLQQGERAGNVLYALEAHFLRLLLYRALREEGRTDQEIASRMDLTGSRQWVIERKLRPQSATFDEERLREALTLLIEAEYDMKTGRLGEQDVLLRVTASLCGIPASRRGG